MTENKYSRGKIYKLVSNQTEDVYYGSTIEDKLTNRLASHRRKYKLWLNDKYHYVTSFEIVKFDDVKIILLENFPCSTIYELCARENYYIENNDCVNKHKAFTGLDRAEYKKQYSEQNKDVIQERNKLYRDQNRDVIQQKQKIYYEQNKDKLLESKRQYYEQNKDEILEKYKQYYEQNKDEKLEKAKQYYEQKKDIIREKQKQYHEKNKEKIQARMSTKITCGCGVEIRKADIRKHERTKRHQAWLHEHQQTAETI